MVRTASYFQVAALLCFALLERDDVGKLQASKIKYKLYRVIDIEYCCSCIFFTSTKKVASFIV